MSGRPPAGTGNQFQTLLFSQQGLINGEHTLKLTNVVESQGKNWLDVDYVVITREVRTSTGVSTIIASHEDFTYSTLWNGQTNMVGYRNSTAHRTNTAGETATLKFRGSEIFLYGGVGPNFGTFQVQVDSQKPLFLNASRGVDHPPVTLFTTNGLGDGQHTLTITNLESGKFLAIDYAEYTPTSDSSSSNARLIGGVVGGVLGVLVVLALLGWLFIRRRRRAWNNGLNVDGPLPQMTTSPHWEINSQSTPYVNHSGQPLLGYVGRRPEAPRTRAPATGAVRKANMFVSHHRTVRFHESSYRPVSQHRRSSVGNRTDHASRSIHEVDLGALTLPPMYDQVYSRQPPPRNSNTPMQT
ncbi:hypothetical protein RSOLAG22IIIB_10002 [Rhizoctonia solani]|uniref:Transmembrane protein n=1 Tax=Rhizoctonia solani TaxID=456999 RepID=A0A0K6G1B8_9AGAM|nr:hypothetical protein RSOLAG22IIIB_10002 [Rhizoctonia solani]